MIGRPFRVDWHPEGGHTRGAKGGIQSTTGHHAAYAAARTMATAVWAMNG